MNLTNVAQDKSRIESSFATRLLVEPASETPGSVLLIGNFLSSAHGTRGVCEDLAARLVESGWNVITTSTRVGRVARLLDMVMTVRQKRSHYSVAQVDVYSGPAFRWAEIVSWMLHRAGKPYVLTLHGGNLPTFASRVPHRVRHLLSSAAVVTTPSRYLLEHMRNYRSDLVLLPNALDLQVANGSVRKKPVPSLVWLRAFHTLYNPSLAPRALALLTREFPTIRLAMVGPDKGDGSLQATQKVARALGIADHMSFPGGVPKKDVPLWMNRGDIFLNTTNADNTPVSVLEAMACGLCVVSTNVGGIPSLLEHDVDALLVAPDDPAAMAAAIRRILVEPGLAERLSSNAMVKAKQFDWSVILPQWETLLNTVAQGHQR